ncbi:MAG: ribonuclease III [Gammaproteobacteria bacterium]|nr:ribonuclease III [Gammaproteobacteria bacterium]
MLEDIKNLINNLDYTFKDPKLLSMALTHRSAEGQNNERLEFLGDAVLSCIIAEVLYAKHPNAAEGELSRMRSSLVNGEMLAGMARSLHFSPCLKLGVGEIKSGGRKRSSILADAFEAVIGAIYLDGGMDSCRNAVLTWYGDRFEDLSLFKPIKDSKSLLQEWLQARRLPLPDYQVKVSGAAHIQRFYVVCTVNGLDHSAEGVSTSRRKAEQLAAANFLEQLHDD